MSIAQLVTAIGATNHNPCLAVLIDGKPVSTNVLSVEIDLGYDTVSSAATVTMRSVPSWLDFRQSCEIRLGFDGHLEVVTFYGIIEDDGRRWAPFDSVVKAVGRLRLTQYDYPDEVTYTAQTDTVIVADLLDKAGITAGQRDVAGEGVTFGVAEDVVLQASSPTWSLINRLDQITGYRTFDCPDGTVRRMLISGLPAASAAWTYTEGSNVLSLERQRSSGAVRNRVTVDGLLLYDGTQAHAENQAESAYVPTPPTYYAYGFQDDLIEEDAYAGTVATRKMTEFNRLRDGVELEVPGNPLLVPGQTIAVVSGRVGLAGGANYWLKHIRHRFDDSGFTTRLSLEGGIGDAGYSTEIAPIAAFTWFCDRENLEIGGTATTVYTVTCDGAGSYDPDGEPGALTYAWSNNANAVTGTAMTYSTYFTEAQIGGTATVSLTVTDADANTDTNTQTITGGTVTTLARTLYVAGGASAYATPDGGATWREYAPTGDTILSTPEGAAIDGSASYSYFGAQSGALYYTADALTTTPLVHHSFGSPVECAWINETNRERVVVGLYNGQIHATGDASAGTAATWTQLKSYANPVYWVAESPLQVGQYWVCTGNELRISFDGLANDAAYATFPAGTARHIANSFIGNYVSAFVPSGGTPVRDDADQAYGLGGTLSALWGCATHHLYDDRLWYAGGTGHWYERGPGSASFAYVSSIPDTAGTACGTVNHLVRDPGNQNVAYIAAEDGLFKTWDGGLTFARMLSLTAAGKRGLQVGVGSLRLQVATGKRVFVAGPSKGASTGGYFAYTENIWEASPVWVANVAGLGTNGYTECALELDPLDPSNIGYMILDSGAGSNYGLLYKNTDMRGAGSWTAILNKTTIDAVLGFSTSLFWIRHVAVCPRAASSSGMRIVALIKASDAGASGYFWALWSDDRGTTWSGVSVVAPGGIYSQREWMGLALGQHSTGLAYAAWQRAAGSLYQIYKSTDYGTTWSLAYTAASGLGPIKINPTQSSDQEALAYSAAGMLYTSDAFANVATRASGYSSFNWDAATDSGVVALADTTGANCYRSADKAQNIASSGTLGHAVKEIRGFTISGLWYAVALAVNNAYVYTAQSNALDTWTERTGNLAAVGCAQATTVRVDPTI